MDPNSFQASSLLLALFFSLLVLIIRVPTTLCADDPRYSNSSETIRCGNVINIGYPFWGMNRPSYCGPPELELKCEDEVPKLTMNNETTLRILQVIINPGQQILQVARDDYWDGYCSGKQVNTSINFSYFRYNTGLGNLTIFYGCSSSSTLITYLSGSCTINGNFVSVAYSTRSAITSDILGGVCSTGVIVPIYEAAAHYLESNPLDLNDSLKGGFELQWSVYDDECTKCRDSDGVCRYNQAIDSFSSFCRDQPPSQTICSSTQGMYVVSSSI